MITSDLKSRPSISSRSASTKINHKHLSRLAIVYVRQSTQQQVLENRESRERQYALANYASELGWPSDRILIIDEDQGISGKSADNRPGFQRLLSEVSLKHVEVVPVFRAHSGLRMNELIVLELDRYLIPDA